MEKDDFKFYLKHRHHNSLNHKALSERTINSYISRLSTIEKMLNSSIDLHIDGTKEGYKKFIIDNEKIINFSDHPSPYYNALKNYYYFKSKK